MADPNSNIGHLTEFAQEAADRFGLGSLVEPPTYVARGAMGEIWKVVTERGAWAVKRLFWDDAPPRPDDVLVQLAAADAGIPLARPVLAPQGDAVVALAAGRARAYEWVELGAPIEPPVPPLLAAEAGRYLGVLHALDLPTFGEPDPWYSSIKAPAEWDTLERAVRDAGKGWADDLTTHRGVVEGLAAIVAEGPSGPEIVCHRDYDRWNVLPRADGAGLVVLDWENAGLLAADADLAATLLPWATDAEQIDGPSLRAFVESYRTAGGWARIEGRGAFAAAIAGRVNFLFVQSESALIAGEHQGYAERVVAAMLAGAVSRVPRVIDELLDALAALPSGQ